MDVLPLEIILHIFSFTDVTTWHICRETCSTIARMLKKRIAVIKSMQMKDFDSIVRTLRRSKSDRLSVRFTKIPKATTTPANIRRIYEELSTLENITELDVTKFNRLPRQPYILFPLAMFTRLESVRFYPSISTAMTLPPNLTKLSEANIDMLHQPSASQLLDLEFNLSYRSANGGSFDEYCTNLTRLIMNIGREVHLQRLTALKDLQITNTGMPNLVHLPSMPNLESLQIENADVKQENVLQYSKLTKLTISMNSIKWTQGVPDLSAWSSLTRLRELTIRDVTPDSEAVETFMSGLPNLESLTLHGFSSPILPLDGSRLTKLHAYNIPYLDLSRYTTLRDILLTLGTAKVPADNLTSIEAFQTNKITFLGSLTNVRSLRTAAEINFNDFPNLEKLFLTRYLMEADLVRTITVLTRLTRLTILDDNCMDLPYLASLTNLVQLHILNNARFAYKKSTRRHVKHITSLQKLEELILPRLITAHELDSISLNLTRLTFLSVRSKDADGSALTRLTNLIEVYFNSPKALKGLAKILESQLPYLVTFELSPVRDTYRLIRDLL